MQDLVGIVRVERRWKGAGGIARLKPRAPRWWGAGNREYNNGWHTALDLRIC
jgi:succinate dehydrogenase / fumarate reductase, flavoprotein subunit